MGRLAAYDLLRLWEAGTALHPIDRALALLGDPDGARLPLGVRDARLLELRAATLGDSLEATEQCPGCGTRVELALSCSDLQAGTGAVPERWLVEHGDVRIAVRPLDSIDAAAAVAAEDVTAAAVALLERAVVAVEQGGEAVPLPAGAADAVAASLMEHDPGAELLVDLACPDCGAGWQRVLDVAAFVWAELAARAERLLDEVHRLARGYGWSEGEILGLSDARRAAYLGMVDS